LNNSMLLNVFKCMFGFFKTHISI